MAVTATAGLVVGLAASQAAAREGLRLTTVSNPNPALVSGGQVLLRATLPDDRSSVRITENGQDVTSAFHTQPDGSLLGLVTGLRDGRNTVTATTGGEHATLQVVNHSITGPVFSGPQQVPFYCQTTAFGLAPAVMPLCSAPTVVSYVYRNTAGAFAPLADPAGRPADLAAAKVGGRSVPYVVRVETGTIDRAVYQMAALYDGRDPSPFTPNTSWNDRLVYTFGGGCNAGYHQGASTAGVLNDLFLAQGYAVTSSSLNVLDNNCSSIISAEAAMMVKEHFIDTYGPVAHTIGWGGSGGAIQQYDIADAYPGILDGIVPDVTFTDPSTTLDPVVDCRLLDNFFAGAGSSFTAAQRTAVAGFRDYDSCVSWDAAFANRVTATDSCNAAIPVSATWDPVINPNGVRCNADEQLVNQLGRDPRTGFVRSTLDNVGVQYGLAALKAGQISAAQFVALNAGIGGLDYTGKPQTARTAADPRAVRTAYADDLVNSAGLGLRTTPIIDQRVDLDLAGFGNEADNIHTMEWSFAMRQRLLAANGTAANQVIIESGAAMDQSAAVTGYELNAMDRWLTAIDADHSDHGQAAKVIADKPVGLGDGCYLSATQRILAPVTDPATGPCAATYPVASNPRQVAGEPKAMNVLTCSLQPINWADYTVTFTAAEQAQLRSAFPRGVCNYRDPGVGQREPRGTWLSY
ncbi:DUF6351 family protein [Amycolatopsis sp. NBC_01480]|uniref:DUF6351 family protein n=1 Tax=Amycolatopsis sp. NBC_01480 TaxID=2903562 RepID=UPI003FA425B9